MVKNCSVGYCKNRSSYMKSGLSFYTFPCHAHHPERLAKWACLCGRKDRKGKGMGTERHSAGCLHLLGTFRLVVEFNIASIFEPNIFGLKY